MSWRVYMTGPARKHIKRLPPDDARYIRTAVDAMAIDPFAGDIQKLRGEDDVWRKRAGAFRIKYAVSRDEKIAYVFEVRRRTSNTY